MSDETLPQQEPFLARAARWKEIVTLFLTLAALIGGFVWETKTQQLSTTNDVKQLQNEVKQANLPSEHDRLVKIERDVEWMRRMMERKER